uniref:Uncharacterized protein n=1 Tax=Siphoviridae sp. ctTBR23 TaxID=2825515 RepID=A0A8S5P108_9CAUD|nr:MAG TPA: hypothetical protein [Siphoviridae sp. ctTBR23]
MADYQLSYTGDQVNTAIGQIVNKNITGTLTVETLALTNPLAITQGGTGKDNRADAFSNLADYGSIDAVASNDIPEVWGNKGSGVHFFQQSSGTGGGGGGGSIESVYSSSTIYNWVTYRYDTGHLSPDAVAQLRITAAGQCYTRFGRTRQSNWSTPWTQLLTTSNGIQIVKLWENASPTSAFANQTLTLDFSSYDLMVILFNLDSNSRSVSPAIVPIGHPGASAFQNSVRTFLVHTNDIQFDSVSPSSAVMIPYVIYGVKGVI